MSKRAKRVTYSEEVFEQVCELLETGMHMSETGKLDGMPNRSTLYRWCQKHDDLAPRIARARDLGFDERAERAVAEAKAATDPAKGRLAFDAERWLLSKMNPARYGERQLVQSEISGPNGQPIEITDEAAMIGKLEVILATAAARKKLALADRRHDACDLA